MKDVLYEVRCLKSNEDMIISSFDFKPRTSYNTSLISILLATKDERTVSETLLKHQGGSDFPIYKSSL